MSEPTSQTPTAAAGPQQQEPAPRQGIDETECEPCPPPKPCPTWPKPPCPPPKPDPCADDDDCDPPEITPPVMTGDCCELPESDNPITQLTALQQHLTVEQHQAEQLERVKTSIDDLTTRITNLQQMLNARPGLFLSYKDFYRATAIVKSEILCFIPTVRCQLNLSDKEKDCINKAITAADTAIAKAKEHLDAQKSRVERYQRRWERASWKLAFSKQLYDFFATQLKSGIQTKRDDLVALKPLADPTKDRCLAEFYLREMELQLKSGYVTGSENGCCFSLDLTIGSFLDCWYWEECYPDAYNRAVIEFNEAEWEEKCRKTLLDAATKRLGDLQKTYDDLVAKRRDTILATIKASECCKSPC
jgi:hypothetical protein